MKFNIDIGIGGDDFADAVITGARKTKWYFGREVDQHAVYQIKCEAGGIVYETNLPVILQEGAEWEFKRGEMRTVSEADQREAWELAVGKFPTYGGSRDFTQDAFKEFVNWLRSGEAICRIRKGGTSTDRNSVEHHNCSIVKSAVKADVAAPKPSAPTKPAAPAPKAKPSAPKAPAKKAVTSEDAWYAYEHSQEIVNDPSGAKYWERVAEITGKSVADWQSFTADDWQKCIDQFALPF